MDSKIDPMGRAIADFWKTRRAAIEQEQSDADIDLTESDNARPMVKTGRLRVFSPMFEEDEIPLHTLFRNYNSMPSIEKKALDMAKGRTLDVGAASGCHTLELQKRGIDVTAIDISPLSVETMKERRIPLG